MRFLHVVGARPNFMKMAPIIREMAQRPAEFEQILVHTGQHYDTSMSQVFFAELELSQPDVNLEVGSGSHAQQTARIMQRCEPVAQDYRPDGAVVPGASIPLWAARRWRASWASRWRTSNRACVLSTASCRRRSTGP